jgi:hypothetical protein
MRRVTSLLAISTSSLPACGDRPGGFRADPDAWSGSDGSCQAQAGL